MQFGYLSTFIKNFSNISLLYFDIFNCSSKYLIFFSDSSNVIKSIDLYLLINSVIFATKVELF